MCFCNATALIQSQIWIDKKMCWFLILCMKNLATKKKVGRPFTLGAGNAVAPLRLNGISQARDYWRQTKPNAVPEFK